MNTTRDPDTAAHRSSSSGGAAPRSTRRAPGFREASLHDLLIDSCRIGPAPTRSREVFVITVSLVLSAVVLGVLGASAIGYIGAYSIIAVYLAGRWIYGERKVWTNR
ncbi:hypothetical protein [Gordonia zhaorongruii]|uniref:hypothetical protein n=1 Tax=Gordonia zhaorongruii TaxID=2597659 RepID=UPI00104672B5|nr:hypothetical protein [Gordonia zhaorongruii]